MARVLHQPATAAPTWSWTDAPADQLDLAAQTVAVQITGAIGGTWTIAVHHDGDNVAADVLDVATGAITTSPEVVEVVITPDDLTAGRKAGGYVLAPSVVVDGTTYYGPAAGMRAGPADPALTLTASLTWGSVTAPSRESITVASDGGVAGARLDFTGDAASFQIVSVDGHDLAVPVLCSVAGSWYLGPESGADAVIEIEPAVPTGAAESMTVTLVDVEGATVDTATATATWTDAYLGAVQAAAGALGLWSARDLTAGTLAHGATVLTEVLGTGAGLIEMVRTGGTAWSVQAAGKVAGSLGQSVQIEVAEAATYAALTETLSAVEAGCLWFRWPTSKPNYWLAWMATAGVPGIMEADTELVIFADAANIGLNVSGGGGSGGVAHAAIAVGEWAFMAWRRSAGTTYLYVSKSGWKDVGENSSALSWSNNRGIRLGGQGGVALPVQLAGIVVFSADPGEAGLQALFEAVVPA